VARQVHLCGPRSSEKLTQKYISNKFPLHFLLVVWPAEFFSLKLRPA
jgi:hypothetical protein